MAVVSRITQQRLGDIEGNGPDGAFCNLLPTRIFRVIRNFPSPDGWMESAIPTGNSCIAQVEELLHESLSLVQPLKPSGLLVEVEKT